MLSQKRKRGSLKVGDLIEIIPSNKNPAYIMKLDSSKAIGGIYVPTSILGVYLGCDLIDLSVDWVECQVFLYQGVRHALINGTLKKYREKPTLPNT